MFGIFKKKQPKRWREFAAYVQPFMRHSQLAGALLQKANELGLQGKKITVSVRFNNQDTNADEIWFEGDMK